MEHFLKLLGWPKSAFRLYHKILHKNLNKLLVQPNISLMILSLLFLLFALSGTIIQLLFFQHRSSNFLIFSLLLPLHPFFFFGFPGSENSSTLSSHPSEKFLFSAIIVLTSEWSCSQNTSFQNIMFLFHDCNVFYFSKDITDGFNFICVLFVPSWFHQVTFLYFFILVSIFPLEIFLRFLIPFKCLAVFNTRSLRMRYVSLGLIDPVTLR